MTGTVRPEVQRLEEVARPVPKDDEVLIRIHATTVNRADCATREANRRSGPGGHAHQPLDQRAPPPQATHPRQ